MNIRSIINAGNPDPSPPDAPVDTSRATPPWLDRDAWPFAPRWHRLPGGERLHYIDEGTGDPVVLVHGTPTWSFEWRHLVRALRDGHRCLAPDHLGFGLSDRPAGADYSPEAHAARFERWLDAMGLDGYTLVVHDFGGPIALPAAAARPERVRRLVVLNSWMWSFEGDRETERAARLFSGRLGRWMYRRLNASLRLIMPMAYGDRRALTPEIHAQYLAPFRDADAREDVLWALARALLGSGDHYRALWGRRERLRGIPSLVVWGTRDRAFPLRHLERWREALPGARVVELPVGHWPHEEAPDAVAREVAAFLAPEEAPAAG